MIKMTVIIRIIIIIAFWEKGRKKTLSLLNDNYDDFNSGNYDDFHDNSFIINKNDDNTDDNDNKNNDNNKMIIIMIILIITAMIDKN